MSTRHETVEHWRNSPRRSGDKLVIKQCFRQPQPPTPLFARVGREAHAKRCVGLPGDPPAPQREIYLKEQFGAVTDLT
jgi:hypothetical protein